jgi:uncharacterized membrane protein YphA (DoxX/SURF4 family)
VAEDRGQLGVDRRFLLSYKLWIGPRSYPLTPVWPFLKPVGPRFDDAVFAALLLLLALIVVVRNPAKLIGAFVSVALVYALFDQSRWQPWFYEYLLLLAALGLWFASQGRPERQDAALHTCRLIVASSYFWSGVQKMNASFVHGTFAWMIAPLTGFLPAAAKAWLLPLGFVAPFVEIGIGIALLTRRFRTPPILAALAMHALILSSIGPWAQDYNDVVWPWNLAMGAFVVLLFWRAGEVPVRSVLWGNHFAFQKLVLLLFGILPALSLFNLWDSYLSFSLYSGNRNAATIYMADSVAKKFPGDIQDLMTEDQQKVDALGVSDWSWEELNVPAYPEIRIFKNVAGVVCRNATNPSDVKLVVHGKTTLLGTGQEHVYDCASLAK